MSTTPLPDVTGAAWRKSTRSDSNGGQCVEVAFVGNAVAVRDSKDTTGPVLVFGAEHWQAFITGVKADSLKGKEIA